MLHIDPREVPVAQVHGYMLGGVGPRPIALVSTQSPDGQVNLSPFSFFNAFGANPPIVGFSPSRRIRDGSVKDTYNNLVATKECVIQAVTYAMVRQVSLASTEYPSDVDEFVKSGLTPILSEVVKPPRVKESPFQMECTLREMIPLGDQKGSGNLALCEVVRFHIAEDLFEDGIIHPNNIDLVGRQSANFYARASGDAVFEVAKPIKTRGIGIDKLPNYIKRSHILTANNLAQLANIERIPDPVDVASPVSLSKIEEPSPELFHRYERRGQYRTMLAVAVALAQEEHPKVRTFVELTARKALENDDGAFAWQALLYLGSLINK